MVHKFLRYLPTAFALCALVISSEAGAGDFLARLKAAVTDGPVASPTQQVAAGPAEADSVGRACLLCHAAVNRMPPALVIEAQAAGAPTASHPVGTRYDDVVRRDPSSYRRSEELGTEIRLVDGRTSCVSCHQLEKHDVRELATMDSSAVLAGQCLADKRLASGRGGTGLCLGCHLN